MKIPLILLFLLCSGCHFGSEAIPTVCNTDLPGTQYSIYLHGPHDIGYFYTIETPDGDCGFRELGQIEIDESVPPKLEDLGNGVFRVTWGKHPDAAFATLDTKQKLIVADSNKSNVVNVPFDTPRYLRPEYAELRQ